jgi:hypothetical protein
VHGIIVVPFTAPIVMSECLLNANLVEDATVYAALKRSFGRGHADIGRLLEQNPAAASYKDLHSSSTAAAHRNVGPKSRRRVSAAVLWRYYRCKLTRIHAPLCTGLPIADTMISQGREDAAASHSCLFRSCRRHRSRESRISPRSKCICEKSPIEK